MSISTVTRYLSDSDGIAVNGQSANASGGEILVADPGAGYKIVIDFLYINCAADESISMREDTTVILGPIVFKAAGDHFWKHQYADKMTGKGGLLLTANKELQVLGASTGAVQVYCEYRILKEA